MAANLDLYREKLAEYRRIKAEIGAGQKYLKRLEREIKEALGTDEEGRVDGEVAVTWRPAQRWRAADFETEHPEIVAGYKGWRYVEEVDWPKLWTEHPAFAEQYQSKVFLVKDI